MNMQRVCGVGVARGQRAILWELLMSNGLGGVCDTCVLFKSV